MSPSPPVIATDALCKLRPAGWGEEEREREKEKKEREEERREGETKTF